MGTTSDKSLIKKGKGIIYGESLKIKKIKLLLDKSKKSICEIKYYKGYGLGFFCLLGYPDKSNKIHCLITNYNIIDDDFLDNKEYIEIKMNNKQFKINFKKERKIWTKEEDDFTCIEILKEDKIIENINPFNINDNSYNKNYKNEKYDKNGIIISTIGPSKDIEISQGIIYNIKNNNKYFYHDCNTEEGYSGGQIILIDDLSIIGIHKGYETNENKNIAIYINGIINNIINEKNEIKCNVKIDRDEYKEDIILFNNNDNNKNDFINKIDVYIEEKKINIKNEGNKWKINYDFKKVGEYEIKINFNKKLKDINKLFENCELLYSI